MEDIRTRLGAIPGIERVTWSTIPLLGAGVSSILYWQGEGYDRPEQVDLFKVGPDFFATMDIPLVTGRDVIVDDCRQGTRACG